MFVLLDESVFYGFCLPCETPLVSSLVLPPFRNPHPGHYALPLSCKNFSIDLHESWYFFGQIGLWKRDVRSQNKVLKKLFLGGAGSTSTPSPLSLVVQQISCVENHHGRPLADIHSDSNNLIITSLPLNPSNARSVCHVCFTTWNDCIYEIFWIKGGVYKFLNFFMRLVGQNIWW